MAARQAQAGRRSSCLISGKAGSLGGSTRPDSSSVPWPTRTAPDSQAFWTPAGTLRLLGTTSRGEGVAYGISEGTSGFVIGGNVRTGRGA